MFFLVSFLQVSAPPWPSLSLPCFSRCPAFPSITPRPQAIRTPTTTEWPTSIAPTWTLLPTFGLSVLTDVTPTLLVFQSHLLKQERWDEYLRNCDLWMFILQWMAPQVMAPQSHQPVYQQPAYHHYQVSFSQCHHSAQQEFRLLNNSLLSFLSVSQTSISGTSSR